MKEIIKHWQQFVNEWKVRPEKQHGERYIKLDFFDFMEYLSKQIDLSDN
jgi:hypothetical protein